MDGGFCLPIFRRYSINSSNSSSGGIGFCGLLSILFIALKLTGFIRWSWLWILSPLWISLAIRLVLALIIAAIDS